MAILGACQWWLRFRKSKSSLNTVITSVWPSSGFRKTLLTVRSENSVLSWTDLCFWPAALFALVPTEHKDRLSFSAVQRRTPQNLCFKSRAACWAHRVDEMICAGLPMVDDIHKSMTFNHIFNMWFNTAMEASQKAQARDFIYPGESKTCCSNGWYRWNILRISACISQWMRFARYVEAAFITIKSQSIYYLHW